MKKVLMIFIMVFATLGLSGCLKRDNMEDITIYTSNYPSYYVTKRLYGKFSKINSIYPNGANIDNYKLTDKQLKDYSEADLFIFNGISKERDYVTKMRKNNGNLKIIDTTLSMEYTNDMNELWLDPSNLLMIAQNIKTGFNEYIDSYYLTNKISENYDKLKIELSNLDAKIKDTVANSDNKTIVTSNKLFKYLEKYGLTVYCLDEDDTALDKTISDVQSLIRQGKVKYIFVKNTEEENNTIKRLVNNYNVEVIKWHTLANLSEEESANEDYFSIMNNNLELLKNAIY